MGCAPSNLATSSSTAAAAATNTTAASTMEKDASLFFCLNFRRTRRRRCSQQNGQDGSAGSGGDRSGSGNADDLLGGTVSMCNQALLNPSQTKNEADYDKMSSGKKDSIVTVAALGNFTHHVVRRATGSTGTSGTSSSGGGSRPGHRKSSLALTPEDETMDAHQVGTKIFTEIMKLCTDIKNRKIQEKRKKENK